MKTSCFKLRGLRHSTCALSTSSIRLNQLSTFKHISFKICTSKLRLGGYRWGLASCAAADPQRFYTGATHLRLQESQDQKDDTLCALKASQNEEQELRMLERAQAFGIMTMEDLVRECAFQEDFLHYTQLVRRKPYSDNLELWCLLLDFQKLRFGEQGVRRTWHHLKDKAGRLDAFFQGPTADRIWAVLISAGLNTPSFLRQLCRHEIRLGAKRSSLYVEVVGSLLTENLSLLAYRFSQELQHSHPVTLDDACFLFMQACDSTREDARENFCNVYKTFQGVRMYSRVVPYLCSQERFSDAWTMHKFLLSRGDLPFDFESVKPLVLYMTNTEGRFEEFLQDLEEHNIAYEAQARRVREHEKSLQYGIAGGTLNIVSSKTLGVQPSRLSDKFVARAFATKAFSFDFTLHGLRILGLREIGPLALRQIALSAGTSTELCRRLELLKELGVDHGSSMYARVVTGLAVQGKDTLLSDVLASDQHPDVFEDLDLQEKLLAQYCRDSDWRQVDRTLAILRMGNQEFLYDKRLSTQETSLNVLLRSAIRVGDWPGVTKVMAHVKDRGCRLTTRTLRCMHDTILHKRVPGQRPKLNKCFDDVGFLLSLYQNAKNAGIQIPPTFWREPIRRLGMLRRWNDLERVLLWLAALYSPRVGTSAKHASTFKRIIIVDEEHSLSRIFSLPLQRAVVAWAFLDPTPCRNISQVQTRLYVEERRPHETCVDFGRGVRVLRMLRDGYGVPIDLPNLRMVCLRSLRKLFAPGFFLGQRVKYNIRRKYDVSLLPEVLKQLNTAWSGSLFDDESTALHKRILQPRRLVRFRQRRRLRLRHIDAQAQDRCDDHQGDISDEYHSELQSLHVKGNARLDSVEDVVMYRDIYNVSLEDYPRSDSSDEDKRPSLK